MAPRIKRSIKVALLYCPLVVAFTIFLLQPRNRLVSPFNFEFGVKNCFYVLISNEWSHVLVIIPAPPFDIRPSLTCGTNADTNYVKQNFIPREAGRRVSKNFLYEVVTSKGDLWDHIGDRRYGSGTKWPITGYAVMPNAPATIVSFHGDVVVASCHWVMVGYGVFFLVKFLRSARRRLHAERIARLTAAGRCIVCGYDLRGSTDRCPECGTPFVQEVPFSMPNVIGAI